MDQRWWIINAGLLVLIIVCCSIHVVNGENIARESCDCDGEPKTPISKAPPYYESPPEIQPPNKKPPPQQPPYYEAPPQLPPVQNPPPQLPAYGNPPPQLPPYIKPPPQQPPYYEAPPQLPPVQHPPPQLPTYGNPPPQLPPYVKPPPQLPPTPKKKPPQPPHGEPGSPTTCPIDVARIGICMPLLDGILGHGLVPQSDQCCSLLLGLVGLDVEVCLCAAIDANILGIINIDIKLNVIVSILSTCNCQVPPNLSCPP